MEKYGLPNLQRRLAGLALEYEDEVTRAFNELKEENARLLAELQRFGIRLPTAALSEKPEIFNKGAQGRRRSFNAGVVTSIGAAKFMEGQSQRRKSDGDPQGFLHAKGDKALESASRTGRRISFDDSQVNSKPKPQTTSARRRSCSASRADNTAPFSALLPHVKDLRGKLGLLPTGKKEEVIGAAKYSTAGPKFEMEPPADMWRPKSNSAIAEVEEERAGPMKRRNTDPLNKSASEQQSSLACRRSFQDVNIEVPEKARSGSKGSRSSSKEKVRSKSPASSAALSRQVSPQEVAKESLGKQDEKRISVSIPRGSVFSDSVMENPKAMRDTTDAEETDASEMNTDGSPVSQAGEFSDTRRKNSVDSMKSSHEMPVAPAAPTDKDESDSDSDLSSGDSDGLKKGEQDPPSRRGSEFQRSPARLHSAPALDSAQQRVAREIMKSGCLQVPGELSPDLGSPFTPTHRKFSNVSAAPSVKSAHSYMSEAYMSCCEDEENAGLELWPVWRENPNAIRRISLGQNAGRKSVTQNGSPVAASLKQDAPDSRLPRAGSKVLKAVRSWCIIHPNSQKRMVWDIVGMLFMVYDLIVIPLHVFDPPETFVSNAMSWLTLFFWSTDIPLSFLSGFQVNGAVEMEPNKIALRYLSTWFLFDALVITIDWILTYFDKVLASKGSTDNLAYMKMGRSARIVRMLRLLRLLRLLKVQGKLSDILEYIQSESLRIILGIVKLIIAIMLLNHVIACGWFSIGNLDAYQDTWVQFYRLDERGDIPFKYTTSLHWSLTQFTPASMEVNGRNAIERAYTVCVLLFAMVTFSSFISSITNATTLLRNLNSQRLEERTALFKYLKQHQLPMGIASDVWSWVLCTKDKSHHRIHEKDVKVLQLLPKSLRIQLKSEVYSPQVSHHPFFLRMMDVNPTGVAKLYAEVMDEVAVGLGQELFVTGEVSHSMYWLITGSMQYSTEVEIEELMFTTKASNASKRSGGSFGRRMSMSSAVGNQEYVEDMASNGENVRSRIRVRDGQWISEPVLWVRWSHRGQLAALTHCELYAMSSAKFLEYITRDAANHLEACQYARGFLHYWATNEVALHDMWQNDEVLNRLAKEAFDENNLFSPRFPEPGTPGAGNHGPRRFSKGPFGNGFQTAPCDDIW